MERIKHPNNQRAAGFTLVEVLAVIAIMAALLSLAVHSAGSSAASLRLQGSAEAISALAAQARQRATTTGLSHELRLYQWRQDGEPRFAWHLYEVTAAGEAQLTGQRVLMDESIRLVPGLSSLFTSGLTVRQGEPPGLLQGIDGARYVSITVHPSGATDLPEHPRAPHVSFATREALARSDEPADFVMLVFEPRTLSVSLHRPGA